MGDIAEMMLDGTLCEGCGEYLGSNNGYATRCAGCRVQESQKTSPRGDRKRMVRRLWNAPKPNRDVAIKRDDAWRIIDLLKEKKGDQAREELVRCFIEAVAPETKKAGATPAR